MMASENKQHSWYAGIVLLKLILNSLIQDSSQTWIEGLQWNDPFWSEAAADLS